MHELWSTFTVPRWAITLEGMWLSYKPNCFTSVYGVSMPEYLNTHHGLVLLATWIRCSLTPPVQRQWPSLSTVWEAFTFPLIIFESQDLPPTRDGSVVFPSIVALRLPPVPFLVLCVFPPSHPTPVNNRPSKWRGKKHHNFHLHMMLADPSPGGPVTQTPIKAVQDGYLAKRGKV